MMAPKQENNITSVSQAFNIFCFTGSKSSPVIKG